MKKTTLSPEELKQKRIEGGRKGGLRTKSRMLAKNPHYYQDIGLEGGMKVLKERGVEHYRRAVAIREAKKREAQS